MLLSMGLLMLRLFKSMRHTVGCKEISGARFLFCGHLNINSLKISKCFQIVYILFFSSILFRIVDLFGPSIYIRLCCRVGSELRLYVIKIMIIFIRIVMQVEKTNKQDSIQQTKRGVKMGIRRVTMVYKRRKVNTVS